MDDVENDRAAEQAERKHDQHLMYRMSEKLCATVHDLLTSPELVTHEVGTKEKRARSSPPRRARERGRRLLRPPQRADGALGDVCSSGTESPTNTGAGSGSRCSRARIRLPASEIRNAANLTPSDLCGALRG